MKTSVVQSEIPKNDNSFDAIKEAHKLSGKPNEIKQYYDQWSVAYDQDVTNEAYCAPDYIATYFDLLPKHNGTCVKSRIPQVEIIDSGCGTGLVGVALRRMGYYNIDGFDLSHEMIKKAQERQAYRTLMGGCDMTQCITAYTDNRYDAAISCGVFTLGHVPPTALEEMIRVTKSGGLIVVSTRKSYYDSTNFQAVCDQLQADNKIGFVSSIMNGPYIAEEGAHYWAFRVN